MIFSYLLKNKSHFTSISKILLLFLSLQITACGSDNTSAANSNANIITLEKPNEIEQTNNSAAIITGVDNGSVTEDSDPDNDNLLEVNGKLNITDSDVGEAAFNAALTTGNYGRLAMTTDGKWYYIADNDQTVIQSLSSTATLTESIIVSSIDGTTHTITITINGVDETNIPKVNTPAVISGIDKGSVTEDSDPDNDKLLEVSGKLNITDSDAGESAFNAKLTIGNYGRVAMTTNGNWYYSADNSQAVIQNLSNTTTLTDKLIVRSIDGTTHTITITIYGTDEANTPAIISGVDKGSVTEDSDPDNDKLLEVSGKLNVTDSDAGESAFIAEFMTSSYGRINLAADGNWYYSADNEQAVIQNLSSTATLTENFIVRSIDGTTHAITITIYGVDETSNTPSDINVTWTAPAEREDNNPLSLSEIAGYKIYYGTTQGQYTSDITINDSTAISYTFTDLTPDTRYFVLTTLDTDGRESQYSTEVAITN